MAGREPAPILAGDLPAAAVTPCCCSGDVTRFARYGRGPDARPLKLVRIRLRADAHLKLGSFMMTWRICCNAWNCTFRPEPAGLFVEKPASVGNAAEFTTIRRALALPGAGICNPAELAAQSCTQAIPKRRSAAFHSTEASMLADRPAHRELQALEETSPATNLPKPAPTNPRPSPRPLSIRLPEPILMSDTRMSSKAWWSTLLAGETEGAS